MAAPPHRTLAQPQMPSIQVAAQYIKDLSFENPSMGVNIQRPQIDFTVDLQARRMQENGPYEVVIKMRVTAQQEEKTLFLLEIAYGGIFVLDKVPDEVLQPYLLIECLLRKLAPEIAVNRCKHWIDLDSFREKITDGDLGICGCVSG